MNMLTNLSTKLPHLGLCFGLAIFSISSAQAQADITWTGAVNTIYTNPRNWNLGRVPNWMDNVTIPATTNQPVLDATLGIGTAGDLNIGPNATLTLNPQSELDLFGNLNLLNNSTFVGMGLLSVRSRGASPTTPPTTPTTHIISGVNGSNIINISDLELTTNAPTTLNVPMRLMRQLALTSNLTTTSAGTLTLLSNPTVTAFVINQGGVVVGNVTVQRAIDNSVNTGVGYRHYSAPVTSTTVADLATTTGFTPEISAANTYNNSATPPTTTPFPTVYGYDQALVNRTNSSPNFDKGFFAPTTLTTPLVSGRGYTVNLGGSQLVDFVGTLTNGDVPVTVSRNATGTLNSDDAGWQFLGNPYPSAIDWSRAAAVAQRTSAGIADGMYVYSSTSQYGGFYRAYANGVGNPVIPLGQAFFVRKTAPGTSSTFTFTNDFRLTTSDGTTFQRPIADVRPQLEMALHSSDKVVQDMLNVYFQNSTTAGVDAKYDAVKALNNNGMMLNTVTPDGQALSIDGRPLPTDQLTIPLALKVATSGTYTLSTEKLANMGDLHTYLRDIKTGALTDLAQQPTYSFNLNADNTTSRFELVFSAKPIESAAPAALTNQVSLYPSPAKDVAFIELPASLGGEAVKATLIDGLGRTVRSADLPAQGEATHKLSLSGLGTGIYVLRLHTSAGVVAKRLAIQ